MDYFASEQQFLDHLVPIWRLTGGEFTVSRPISIHAAVRGIPNPERGPLPGDDPVVVASYGDIKRVRMAGRRRIAYIEHGIGQSYTGDQADRSARSNASYSGGRDHDDVGLFLVPNQNAAQRWRENYPDAMVEIVGCPKLDEMPVREPGPGPVIAVSFHWNLLPEGIIVSGPVPTGVSLRRYSGPIVDVITDAADQLSVSPDHPVLTRRGWVRAGELMVGDYLVRAGFGKGHGRVAPDGYMPPSRVEDVARSLLEPLKVRPSSMPSTAPDFDGERLHEEVDVIGPDGFLRNDVTSAAFAKHLDDPRFEGADLTQVVLASGRSATQFFNRGAGSSATIMHGQMSQIGAGAVEYPVDGGLADAIALGQFMAGLPGDVTVHQITGISIRDYVGHGYDFTTVPRWYLANGFVVHNCQLVPETMGTFRQFSPALPALAKRYAVIGHGHPRAFGVDGLAHRYQSMGIEIERDFEKVLERADLYICDNSSSLFEFAATGRPVVVLNGSGYRRHIDHGLRFWEAAKVGVNCDRPADLLESVAEALQDAPQRQKDREAALDIVYGYRHGAAERAAAALTDWKETGHALPTAHRPRIRDPRAIRHRPPAPRRSRPGPGAYQHDRRLQLPR